MNYFWFDHRALEGKPKHKTFGQLVTLFSAQEVKGPDGLNDCFFCFVHAGNAEGKRQWNWEAKANAGNKQFIVLLSIEGEPVPTKKVADGVVALHRERLDQLAGEFDANPDRKNEFMRSVASGTPKWELLVSNPETEHLIAYYLVLLATEKGLSVNPDHELREKAFREYRGLAKLAPNARKVERSEDLSKDAIGQLLAEWEGK